jgi:hypothetical protein
LCELKKTVVFIVIFLGCNHNYAQVLTNMIKKKITFDNDTVKIDSLSLVPGTFKMYHQGELIQSDRYELDDERSYLYIKDSTVLKETTELNVEYRRFRIDFYRPIVHQTFQKPDSGSRVKTGNGFSPPGDADNFFTEDELNKSGSLSRGISIGNNQDASVNSDFNLQLSGNISPDISISGTISDSNIPVQADGTSQHLREFDKVFIELKSKKSTLIAGDFEISSSLSSFSKYRKNVKGIGFTTEFETKRKFKLKSSLNTTLSKGKYNILKIQGIESNQGPYKLIGVDNEMYIVVLSGSERIYINGNLLQRGNDNDYVIDYNTAELTFTAKQIITKDSRITAEFEYSEQSYARFAVGTEHVFNTEKSEFFFQYFNEYDAKNQTLRQDISDEQKVLLHTIGDDLNSAVVPNVIENESHSANEILYRKTDTLVNNIVFRDVYVYTSDTLMTTYILGFSYVGEHKGYYVRMQTGLNGKVYQWTAPIDGLPQGNYEPVRQLISPKQKQVITLGGKTKIKGQMNLNYELSISDNDRNLFSTVDDDDNIGYAYKAGMENCFLLGDSGRTTLKIGLEYMYINKKFYPLEPFRTPEFERDWNLGLQNFVSDEHLIHLTGSYKKDKLLSVDYRSEFLKRTAYYSGFKNKLIFSFKKKGYAVSADISYLASEDTIKTSDYIRYGTTFCKAFPKFSIGIVNTGEQNIMGTVDHSSLSPLSFRFHQFEAYSSSPEEKERSVKLSYINREDFIAKDGKLVFLSNSHDLKLSGVILNSKKNRLETNVTYRKLNLSDTLENTGGKGNSTIGNLAYSWNIFNGALNGSSFLEHANGNEFYNEYSYIEVNKGQGYYTWIDFNGNQLKELNEFVKANFQDEANFIKISLPTNRLQTVYNQSFNQSINIIPRRIWQNKTGIQKIASMFSDQFNFKMIRKISDRYDYYQLNIPDSGLLSGVGNLRNNLLFETAKANFKIGYSYTLNSLEVLLVNGNDSRQNSNHEIMVIKKNDKIGISNTFFKGEKRYSSEFFPKTDFNINIIGNTGTLFFKSGSKNEFIFDFTFKKKRIGSGEENCNSYDTGIEYKTISSNSGTISVKFNYVGILFEGIPNTSVSYEMMEGLSPGKNFIWSVLWYKKINEFLQLELNYSGRKTGTNKMIHTGSVNIRAIF